MAEPELPPTEILAVLDFLRSNGLKDAESALKQDMIEKNELGCFDFEKFLFVLPPVKIPASLRRPEGGVSGLVSDSPAGSNEDFVSLGSSTSEFCSSEFTNPYALRSGSRANSETSSDRMSQFGTARDYPDFELQNDLHWYDDKDEDHFLSPSFNCLDLFGAPSEDKFVSDIVTTSTMVHPFENPLDLYCRDEEFDREANNDYSDKPCLFNTTVEDKKEPQTMDFYHFEADPVSIGEIGDIPSDYGIEPGNRKNSNSNYPLETCLSSNWSENYKHFSKVIPNGHENYEVEKGGETNGENNELQAAADEKSDELMMFDNHEDEYEVFNLRIIHRKNRTGFEENKDLPIVLNTVLAGRYYVTEYLGSAAFSKVVQAHDLHTGVDVCLKIIKNDKDFFDQSLDEIKLLKLVNKHDPADQHHILRLYDYFYHQEHLFIVCELLRANLYEFQKFNQESGSEPYFTLSRLQAIARQCLEALDYLHHLGIIHCDLKPENVLIKSYRRCEIKVIDLGSSCFLSDNLCLYVQSRSYRAPEVILGLPYDQKIDLWSLGCILAELISGEVLFPNDGVVMILARVIGMFGPIDYEMLVKGQETHKYFTKEFDLYHLNEETDQLECLIPEESSLENHLRTSDIEFINFVRSLLEVNPSRRPTAKEALEHPWLSYSY
ncbi:Protein kinase superfamily protein [Euphorbia peplus]|nr:Protein kinase superfamily protein [Euphorbia peplus]